VLLDYLPPHEDLTQQIRDIIEGKGDEIVDLHVWKLGPGHHGAIVALRSPAPLLVGADKAKLSTVRELSHVTIEVQSGR
jgi:Co/Zn/Cd efflux system component